MDNHLEMSNEQDTQEYTLNCTSNSKHQNDLESKEPLWRRILFNVGVGQLIALGLVSGGIFT